MRWLSWLRRRAKETVITFDNDGFSVIGGHEKHVRWLDVAKISAYKVDQITYDLICIGVELCDTDICIEVQEEWKGYTPFVSEIERRFNIDSNWWSSVAFPAFQENHRVLYSKLGS